MSRTKKTTSKRKGPQKTKWDNFRKNFRPIRIKKYKLFTTWKKISLKQFNIVLEKLHVPGSATMEICACERGSKY